tara:strand:+ start:110 stop:1543 length:1434 start_codon:yes stop_codon:yes gene_type:complete
MGNQKEAIKHAPKDLKPFLEGVIKNHKFTNFRADLSWNKSKTKNWVINCDLVDVNAVLKFYAGRGTKKDVGGRKVVDIDLKDGYNYKGIRFRETRKKEGKAPDAKTTAMQEAGSKYVFEYALNNKRSGFSNINKFMSDKKFMEGLKKIYPDVDSDWLDVFWKQHKKILELFANTQINRFDHTGGFMDFISKLIKDNFGISKKDNWNPSDIWGVRGNSTAVMKKLEETVFGSKDSQTIQQLNAVMRGMYKANELVGISLKKTSGNVARWEEYNIEKLTLNEVDEYKYKDIKIIINFKPTSDSQSLDSAIQLRQSSGADYNFQVTSNDTSKANQNLKFESKPVGASKARGGKAQIKAVEALMKDNGLNYLDKHQNYPKNLSDFVKKIDGRDKNDYKQMFDRVSKKVTTNVKDSKEFLTVMEDKFNSDKPFVATSKLMQLHFLDEVFKIKSDKKFTEFWTDMLFLSIKKGDRFGPFGKLY